MPKGRIPYTVTQARKTGLSQREAAQVAAGITSLVGTGTPALGHAVEGLDVGISCCFTLKVPALADTIGVTVVFTLSMPGYLAILLIRRGLGALNNHEIGLLRERNEQAIQEIEQRRRGGRRP